MQEKEGNSLLGPQQVIRARLASMAGKARHPALSLPRFVVDPDILGDDEDEDDDRISAGERQPAMLRRAALLVAALDIIDHCIDDLQFLEFEDGVPDPDYVEESFVYERFPVRYRAAYDDVFFRKVLVTAIKVANDLADPDGDDASCIAEEIIRQAIGQDAMEICEEAGLGRPWLDPDEYLQEDADFEFLYSKQMDGLENDPAAQAGFGITVPAVDDWFTPFNDVRLVHPYAETESTVPEVHDLLLRLGAGDPREVLVPEIVDAAAPIASFAPGSEVIALARRAAVAGDSMWVADDSDRERSFKALVSAAAADAGSGWLEWEPHVGADTVRTEPVVILTPHRHFPIGDDEPWVDAAIGGGRMLAIPLRSVVSYRPDPEVRRRWEQAFENLGS